MPGITTDSIGLAEDMFGCPNKCRHCYVSPSPTARLAETDLRWIVDQFRRLRRADEEGPVIGKLGVVTWDKEPDYSDDYRRLYDLEIELSDRPSFRADWSLMSVWRLARDETYAAWAYDIGIRTAQISFFGIGKTHDWFIRRKGAFDECLVATERLLSAGIRPRWQFFLTAKILPELHDLMSLVDRLELRRRCADSGLEFVMFIHTPGPDGEARHIEHLRPTIDQVGAIPAALIDATKAHFKTEMLWSTVGERVCRALEEEPTYPYAWYQPDPLFFIVQGNFDVYTNFGSRDPWWRLGNLRTDPLPEIVRRYETNATPGLHTIHNVPLKDLAIRYGDPDSRLIDGGVECLWVAKHCEDRRRSASVS